MRAVTVLALLLCLGCDRWFPKEEETLPDPVPPTASELHQRFVGWMNERIQSIRNGTLRCDMALFEALHVIGGGAGDVLAYEDPEQPGLIHRSIDFRCYEERKPNGNRYSASECSKDMYIGWTFERFLAGDVEALGRVVKRAIDKRLRMCRGPLSRTVLSLGLFKTIYQAYRKLGGEPILIPGDLLTNNPIEVAIDYTDHLELLHTWFRASINGGATAAHQDILRSLADGSPNNVLFECVAAKYGVGDYDRATGLAMSLCPQHPPTVADYCSPYRWQRDEDEWAACPDVDKNGHGIDCEIALACVTGAR